MPRSQKSGRNANGSGSIRKVTSVNPKTGKKYTYYQARYTCPGNNGRNKQRTISGKTKADVAQKLRAVTVEVDQGCYIPPNKQTLGEWLDTWLKTYTINIKPRTYHIYESEIRLHIKPYLGDVRLESLTAPMIQGLYQQLMKPSKKHPKGLSPKTIKNGVLKKALKQAALVGYLRFNPADACILPRCEKPKIVPLDDVQIVDFLTTIRNHTFERLFTVALFTGMREGEVLGLTWDNVDFEFGTITVCQQIQLHQEKGMKAYELVPTKTDKVRSIAVAPTVLNLLKQEQRVQTENRLKMGGEWHNDLNLVFTDPSSRPWTKSKVYREFKRVAAAIGRPDARFHDLRHSFAVASLRAGDDIKTLQGNLGHATAAFTLDVYGHVTLAMKRESAARMEAYIQGLSAQQTTFRLKIRLNF